LDLFRSNRSRWRRYEEFGYADNKVAWRGGIGRSVRWHQGSVVAGGWTLPKGPETSDVLHEGELEYTGPWRFTGFHVGRLWW
jgi:hypothetical protein